MRAWDAPTCRRPALPNSEYLWRTLCTRIRRTCAYGFAILCLLERVCCIGCVCVDQLAEHAWRQPALAVQSSPPVLVMYGNAFSFGLRAAANRRIGSMVCVNEQTHTSFGWRSLYVFLCVVWTVDVTGNYYVTMLFICECNCIVQIWSADLWNYLNQIFWLYLHFFGHQLLRFTMFVSC